MPEARVWELLSYDDVYPSLTSTLLAYQQRLDANPPQHAPVNIAAPTQTLASSTYNPPPSLDGMQTSYYDFNQQAPWAYSPQQQMAAFANYSPNMFTFQPNQVQPDHGHNLQQPSSYQFSCRRRGSQGHRGQESTRGQHSTHGSRAGGSGRGRGPGRPRGSTRTTTTHQPRRDSAMQQGLISPQSITPPDILPSIEIAAQAAAQHQVDDGHVSNGHQAAEPSSSSQEGRVFRGDSDINGDAGSISDIALDPALIYAGQQLEGMAGPSTASTSQLPGPIQGEADQLGGTVDHEARALDNAESGNVAVKNEAMDIVDSDTNNNEDSDWGLSPIRGMTQLSQRTVWLGNTKMDQSYMGHNVAARSEEQIMLSHRGSTSSQRSSTN